jgi:acetoin utilization deacetylase AcuC-like enzyme
VLSFGADTFSGDPISHFAIETEDFVTIGARIAAMGLPTAIIMEGGYAVGDLGGNVVRFLSGFPD